jgi:photosystem II stability/assembly factor-like uncharacterized protein
MTQQIAPNTINPRGLYVGSCYAFEASGGYTVEQGFRQIELKKPDLLKKYDVTDAIQVKFSARTLNRKLNILKDPSNIRVVQASFDNLTETLNTDSIKVCSCDFIDGIDYNSVISIGKVNNLYSDFKSCVSNYFGDPGGFMSIFSNADSFISQAGANNGVFDASAFVQVINSSKFNMEGSFVSDLSGDITIGDINNLLTWVVDSNVFQNRDPVLRNYGIIDGFVAGDLIYIPTGFTISLSVDIQPEVLLPINNVGPSYLDKITNNINWTRGHVKRQTTYSTTNITQTTTVPVLLVLTDTVVANYTTYGKEWVLVGSINEGDPNKWLGITVSTDGRFQSAIDESGNIFSTRNYGTTWAPITSIGPSPCNNISMSFTGQHQTVSNGRAIFISDDYGQTWRETFNGGTSRIFVNISLNGQYQTVVSCGDTVYLSSDYGNTWTPIESESDLYFSVEGFPTAGVAISYTGRYQTIVTEEIYISSDYGYTWTNVSPQNGFDDRNWMSVAMASDGKYQTAIENGGEIYVSNDYGNIWAPNNSPEVSDKTWASITVSATGQYQTAIEQNGYIHTSNNYGATWDVVDNEVVGQQQWQSVSVSADGLIQTALSYGGQVYISHTIPQIDMSGGLPCVCD